MDLTCSISYSKLSVRNEIESLSQHHQIQEKIKADLIVSLLNGFCSVVNSLMFSTIYPFLAWRTLIDAEHLEQIETMHSRRVEFAYTLDFLTTFLIRNPLRFFFFSFL